MRSFTISLILIITIFNFCDGKLKGYNTDKKIGKLEFNDSVLMINLLSVPMEKFIGGSIEKFISDSTIKAYSDFIFVDQKPGELSFISFKYTDDIFIDIYIDDFKYLNQFNEQRRWDFELVKRERIDRIKILKGDSLIKVIQRTN